VAKYYVKYKDLQTQAASLKKVGKSIATFEGRLISTANAMSGTGMAGFKKELTTNSKSIKSVSKKISSSGDTLSSIITAYKLIETQKYQNFIGFSISAIIGAIVSLIDMITGKNKSEKKSPQVFDTTIEYDQPDGGPNYVDEPRSLLGGDYTITSGFGPRGTGYHKGIDLAAPKGTVIFPVLSGIVIAVEKNGYPEFIRDDKSLDPGVANYILILHEDGTMTRYVHCDTVNVEIGQEVSKDTPIGTVGNTGDTSANGVPDKGYHLHFEVKSVKTNSDGTPKHDGAQIYENAVEFYENKNNNDKPYLNYYSDKNYEACENPLIKFPFLGS